MAGSGAKEEKFIVHKSFACHYSPVFKAAFESGFIEGQTQTYKFDDVEGGVVQLLVKWLYTQEFTIEIDLNAGVDMVKTQVRVNTMLAVKLWILANKLLIFNLQNKIIDWLRWSNNTSKFTPTVCLEYVYAHTSVNSALRRLFVAQCAHGLPRKDFHRYSACFPKEMLLDLAVYFATKSKMKDKIEDNESFYVKIG